MTPADSACSSTNPENPGDGGHRREDSREARAKAQIRTCTKSIRGLQPRLAKNKSPARQTEPGETTARTAVEGKAGKGETDARGRNEEERKERSREG